MTCLPFLQRKTKKKNTKTKTAQSEGQDGRFINDLELNTGMGVVPVAKTEEALPAFDAKPVPTKKKKKARQTEETSLAAIPDEDDGMDHRITAGNSKPVAESEPVADKGVPNSDCRTAMSNDEFENFALKILDDEADDDAKIKILSKNKRKTASLQSR